MKRLSGALFALVGALTVLSGCASGAETQSGTAASDHYPVSVENCGETLTFTQSPERVVLLESAPVPTLSALHLMDRVVARAGTFAPEYYSEETLAELEEIPVMSEDVDASGHLIISPEAVIGEAPDLVMGEPGSITRATLADAGAQLLVQNVYCPNWSEDASFEGLYDQVRVFGTIFDVEDEAEQLVSELQDRVAAASHDASGVTVAVLYPSTGGGPLYAYGRGSMANPQVEALGFENVFDDVADRVFEVSMEELLKRNPDEIIVLYQDTNPEEAIEAVKQLPGADGLTAGFSAQLFNFTEPPSPLTVDGLERMSEYYFG